MRTVLLPSFCLVALAIGSCSDSLESCDPGQVLQMHVCFDVSHDGGAPAVDTGAGGGCPLPNRPDGGPPMCAATTGWGDNCTDTVQCPCGLDLCAIQPGASCGFCTRMGCLANPSICPAGWHCFDASAFQAGYSLCIKN